MNVPWWEGPSRFMCDYWWVLLIIIVLGLTAYFTRDLWLPAIMLALGI
jgi:hypothetical protein